jgi:hypothetical protein
VAASEKQQAKREKTTSQAEISSENIFWLLPGPKFCVVRTATQPLPGTIVQSHSARNKRFSIALSKEPHKQQ